MISKLFSRLEIDSDIKTVMALRIWTIFAGAVLMILIPFSLSRQEQGFYFTFLNLLTMQVFFELGLNSVITQIIGHEAAHLTFDKNYKPNGEITYLSRYVSVFQFVKKVYTFVAILFFIFSTVFGLLFFKSDDSVPKHIWQLVWILLTLLTAINLYISPFLAGIEGAGFVARVAKLRLKQSFIGYALLWILLICNFGLVSMIAVPLASILFSGFWLIKTFKWLHLFDNDKLISKISWRNEILPFQWRIAISWFSGFFIFQLFTPTTFKYFGAVEAGKVGLSFTVFTSIASLSFSWVNAKVPVMTKFIALGRFSDLKVLFWKLMFRSTILNLIMCLGFILTIEVLKYFSFPVVERVVSIKLLMVLMVITVVNNIIFTSAAYMRAFKEEPMLLNSVTVALLVIGFVFWGARYSIETMFFSYGAVVLSVSLPWTLIILNKYLKR